MVSVLVHTKTFFEEESPRDLFKSIDMIAQWAALLIPQTVATAQKVSLVADRIGAFFVWPQLIMDGRKLFESQKRIYHSVLFTGTAAEALIHLHERSLSVLGVAFNLGKYISPINAVYFGASCVVDVMDGVEESQKKSYNIHSVLVIAKVIVSIILTLFAAITFVSEAVVMPTATLVLSTLYIGLKVSSWDPVLK